MRPSQTSDEFSSPPVRPSNTAGKFFAILLGVVFIALLALAGKIFERVDAGEVVVIQYPSGKLAVIAQPTNFAPQYFGTPTHFKRSSQHSFSLAEGRGTVDESLKTRFNDGAHALISGSIRFDLPESPEKIIDLYRTYRTQNAIDKELIAQNVTKAVYMTGPLMSSKESYSDRRNELIADIEDQAINGVYKTVPKDVEIEDPITQTKKWIRSVDILKDPKTGVILRQEESPVQRFGIRIYNLNINDIKYDPIVEQQIAAQQQAIMQVQTAIAQSKEAEQKALTAAKQGEAKATEAKWEQEVVKAKAVVVAEQEAEVQRTNAKRDKVVAELGAEKEKNVADLAHQAAEFTKLQQIALGQGEGERKRLAMVANGALELKLETWLEGQKAWAQAFSTYRGDIVPRIVTAGSSGGTGNAQAGGANGFEGFMQLMSAKAANDLSLDMRMRPPEQSQR
jgi:hypothetical protein